MAEEEYAKLKKQREAERREREMYEDEEWIEEVESRPRRYAQQPQPAAAPAPAPKPGRLSDSVRPIPVGPEMHLYEYLVW